MYQAYWYPWLTEDQFKWSILKTKPTLGSKADKQCYEQFRELGERWKLLLGTPLEPGISTYSASHKFIQWVAWRNVTLVYHGPSECKDSKYWNNYDNCHLNWTNQVRPGNDSVYLSLISQHCKVCGFKGNIPASQQTYYPANWANYLSQNPRCPWIIGKGSIIETWATWLFDDYIEPNTQVSRK